MKKNIINSALIIILTGGGIAMLIAAGPPLVSNDLERLGMRLFKDTNLSLNQNQSCRSCHHPKAGFADPDNLVNPDLEAVSLGSDGTSMGTRNAPSAAYAGFSPQRYFDPVRQEWFGGMFWDGRMDGHTLGDPLAEQAQGPPLNPVEMALPGKQAVIDVIKSSGYYNLWKRVFGPITDINMAYDNFGRAIAAYERSADLTRFSSKYDIAPARFTDSENRGKELFETYCSGCHATTPVYNSPAPVFTSYGYANIGVPANPNVTLNGPDLGLGGDLGDPLQDGKFKIPTLRNCALNPPYSHNGSFATLKQMVAFINDRSGFVPEVNRNLNTDVGSLGLSDNDIEDLIAFLLTLTDNY